jgi:large subunit ribosomal protein L30
MLEVQVSEAMTMLKITWQKSSIGYNSSQRKVIQALGLRRLNHTVVHRDTPTIRGMINAVSHLLRVAQVDEENGHDQ